MKLIVFPTAVGVLVLACWLLLTLLEDCLLYQGDPKFDCWSSLQIVAVFAAMGGALAALSAGLARALLRPLLPLGSLVRECLAAALSSIVLVLLFYSAIRWEAPIGGAAGMLLYWPLASFVICGAALITVKHFTKAKS